MDEEEVERAYAFYEVVREHVYTEDYMRWAFPSMFDEEGQEDG